MDVGVVWIEELCEVALGQGNGALWELLGAQLFKQGEVRGLLVQRSVRVIIGRGRGDGGFGHGWRRLWVEWRRGGTKLAVRVPSWSL